MTEPATTNKTEDAGDATLLSIAEFGRLDLRVAEVLTAEPHPNADKLLVLTVQVGEHTRQLVAGIKPFRAPETLPGTKLVIVTNLEPAKLRGIESQGMLLAAGGRGGVPFALVTVDADVPSGARVT